MKKELAKPGFFDLKLAKPGFFDLKKKEQNYLILGQTGGGMSYTSRIMMMKKQNK